MTTPWYLGPGLEGRFDEASLDRVLEEGRRLQEELMAIPFEERAGVIGDLGREWDRRLGSGELEEARAELVRSTGYSPRLVDKEFETVSQVLSAERMAENVDRSLVGGKEALHRFVGLAPGESIRHLPSGPVMIIASGNSVIPTLIPTAISLVTGNFTVLKPSRSNMEAVVEALSPLEGMAERSRAAGVMSRALLIAHMAHDSPVLDHALARSRLGTINFWGGEPARSTVAERVARNPNRPRLMVNGPLTGVAVLDGASADRSAARGLATNMVLYDQQLCSSPTMGVFIGGRAEASAFCRMVAEELEVIGSEHPVDPPTDALFVLHSARRVMLCKGSMVLSPTSPSNPWTLALSEGGPILDEVMVSFPSFLLHGRRRFLEMVAVGGVEEAVDLISRMPSMPSFAGIDGVQTVGLAVEDTSIVDRLLPLGIYRIVPLEDMWMRTPSEPYDGVHIASMFTYAVHRRDSPL